MKQSTSTTETHASSTATVGQPQADDRQSLVEAILNTVVDGIVTIDAQGTIDLFNPAAERMFGYAADEVVGRNIKCLMPGPYRQQHDAYLKHYQATGEARIIGIGREVAGRRKNGEHFPMELAVSEMTVNGAQMFTGVVKDITERKRFESELAGERRNAEERARAMQRLNEHLTEANESLDQFVYVASHDLKAPLQGVSQLAMWVTEDCENLLPEESKQHLQILQQRVERMRALLTDLLYYSRIGRADHACELLDITETTQRIAELCTGQSGFTVHVADCVPPIRLPRIPFELALRNLICNAIKHHHAASGRIVVRYHAEPDFHRISVEDDGPGIDPDHHQKVFDMFTTLQSRDTVEGSGMGLSIIKKSIEHCGGRVGIDAAFSEGTRFVTYWPRDCGNPGEPEEP